MIQNLKFSARGEPAYGGKIQNSSRGATLLELLMYITIASGVVIVIISLVAAIIRSSNVNQSSAEIRQNVAALNQKVSERVSAANNLGAAYSGWISYYDATGGDLVAAQYVASGGNCTGNAAWNCTVVDSATGVGKNSAISFDSTGNPWISYYEAATTTCDDIPSTECSLKVAHYVGSGGSGCAVTDWTCEYVDNPISTTDIGANGTSISFDLVGNIWVSYSSSESGNVIKVAKYVGFSGTGCTGSISTWTCTVVDDPAANNVGSYSSIKFDSSGIPWISYYDATGLQLKVARYVGASGTNCGSGSAAWDCEAVDNTGTDTGQYSSIAFDFSNKPWVSFYDLTNTALRVATRGGGFGSTCTDSDWTCAVIDNDTDNTGKYSSIAFDFSGNAWVSYYQDYTDAGCSTSGECALVVANYVGGNGTGCGASGSILWTCTTVDDDVDNTGQYSSIIFDSSGTAWVSYYDGAGVAMVAKNSAGSGCGSSGSASWTCSAVDDPANTRGQFSSISFYKPNVTSGDSIDLSIAGANGRFTVQTTTTLSLTNACTDVTWNCYAIESTDLPGQYTDIAIDRDGNPWISYYEAATTTCNDSPSTECSLHVAKYVGSGGTGCDDVRWTCTMIDTAGNVGQYTSIAFDQSGNAWVSYYDVDNTSLKVANYVGSGQSSCVSGSSAWNCVQVDVQIDADGKYTAIAFDLNGKAWVSYLGSGVDSGLKVANYVGSGQTSCTGGSAAWNCTLVDSVVGEANGLYTSIAFDQSGNAWVSYYEQNALQALKVAKYVGAGGSGCASAITTWTCTDVDNDTDDIGRYTSIAFDLSGNAWISYYNFTSSALKLARYVVAGGTGCGASGSYAWTCIVVDNDTDNTGQYSSITFDPLGIAWVAYFDNTVDSVMAAKYVGSGGSGCGASGSTAWLCTTIDNPTTNVVGNYTSAVFDPSGSLWISYNDSTSGDLKIANMGKSISDSTLRYVTSPCTNYDWNCVSVDTANNIGQYTDIALDKAGNPWVSYYDVTNTSLKVANYVGTGGNCSGSGAWNCVTVDNYTDDTGQYTSIAFDQSGNAWVSYYDATAANLNLKAANYVGSGGNCDTTPRTGSDAWNCTTVDDISISTGSVTAIGFDPSNRPWIAYRDTTNTALRVATKGGGFGGACTGVSWTCGAVDTVNVQSSLLSIAFDQTGNPWVSYQINDAAFKLAVANYVGGTSQNCSGSTAWNCTVVNANGNNGYDSSIAFDSSGNAWASHRNSAGNDLWVDKYVGSGGSGCATATWTCTNVDSASSLGGYTSLRMDSSGKPWVTYYDNVTFAIKLAKYVESNGTGCVSTKWTCTVINDSFTDVGSYSSINFGFTNSAWVSYYDAFTSAQDLKVANLGQAITSSKIYLTKCDGEFNYFKKIDNGAPAKDAIRYCFNVNYKTGGDATKTFSQEVRSTVSLR